MASGSPPREHGTSSLSQVDAPPSDPAVCLTLPERLDTAAASALKETIEEGRKQAGAGEVRLDASGVTYVGGLCLQILIASGCPLVAPSEQVTEAYALFGASAFLSEPPMPPKEQ
ncbi:hypothetical protein AA13595_0202 [Gluconacetobacter johannae DSM 13595]|nr:STAS domain-containing protein [Gluconacetobacter johannae]GBQ80039.1 hypothetical protein AA13595_0202 [Gluconacetobacter johannae DSM 13595]